MDLDNLNLMNEVDASDYYHRQLVDMGERVLKGWQAGTGNENFVCVPGRAVWFVGFGLSGLVNELFEAYIKPRAQSPVYFANQGDVPDWALAQKPFIVTVAGSQGHAEMDIMIEQTDKLQTQIIFVDSPLEDVYFSLGFLLAAAYQLEIIPNPEEDIREAVKNLNEQYEKIRKEIPSAINPAKRQGGQLMGRWSMITAAEQLEPTAKYWKRQLNLLAKAGAQAESMLQMLNESIEGICFPQDHLEKMIILFIDAASYSPANRILLGKLKQNYMIEGSNTDQYIAKGKCALAHLLTVLQFGDFMAYYLAMGYQVDPSARAMIEQFSS
jgi:hypothetical protein